MFTGLGTALITPFIENGEVDYLSLKKIIAHQILGGTNALVILGTTGEAPVISFDERERIIDTVLETANGKTKIIVGTGTNDTKHVIEMNKQAEKYGVDGLLIVNPYYNKGTQESLKAHYGFISERTSLPILLYNVPSRTGMNVLPETAIEIHQKYKNIVGIKEASGNISQIAHLVAIKPEEFQVFSGNDDQTLPILALGAQGEISVFSNAFPQEKIKLINAVLNYNIVAAKKLQKKHNKLNALLFAETSPAPIKYLMAQLGLSKNILRLPLTTISKKLEDRINDEVLQVYPEFVSKKNSKPISLLKVL